MATTAELNLIIMKFLIFAIFLIVGLSCKNEFQEKQPKQRKAIKTKTVDLPPWKKEYKKKKYY